MSVAGFGVYGIPEAIVEEVRGRGMRGWLISKRWGQLRLEMLFRPKKLATPTATAVEVSVCSTPRDKGGGKIKVSCEEGGTAVENEVGSGHKTIAPNSGSLDGLYASCCIVQRGEVHGPGKCLQCPRRRDRQRQK